MQQLSGVFGDRVRQLRAIAVGDSAHVDLQAGALAIEFGVELWFADELRPEQDCQCPTGQFLRTAQGTVIGDVAQAEHKRRAARSTDAGDDEKGGAHVVCFGTNRPPNQVPPCLQPNAVCGQARKNPGPGHCLARGSRYASPVPSSGGQSSPNPEAMGKIVRCRECGKVYRELDELEDLRDNDSVCLVCNNTIEVPDWDRVLASYEDEDAGDEEDDDWEDDEDDAAIEADDVGAADFNDLDDEEADDDDEDEDDDQDGDDDDEDDDER